VLQSGYRAALCEAIGQCVIVTACALLLCASRLGQVDGDGLARVSEVVSAGSVLVNKETPNNTADRHAGPDPALPDDGMLCKGLRAILLLTVWTMHCAVLGCR
jgi:hypothetical protein